MCWSILLKGTIGRPFDSPFAQNSYQWKRGENACTQELVKLWHTAVKLQTLERPSAQRALLAACPSPIHSTITLVGGGQPSWPAQCHIVPLSSACSHCTCRQAHGTHSTRPTLEQCGPQLSRDWAKRSSKEGCSPSQRCAAPPPEEFPISHYVSLTSQ